MKLTPINTGFFKLDGGAMFGVVPKKLWQKLNPPDEDNLCTWALRCLLIETDRDLVLIDTGMGEKQSEKFRSFYKPQDMVPVDEVVRQAGYSPGDVTDVLLTHLHFDHVGGAVKREQGSLVPTFKKANYWVSQKQWAWALTPNARERASFHKENLEPLEQAGVLKQVSASPHFELNQTWRKYFDLKFTYGHTEAMIIPVIQWAENSLIFCADLLPSSYHIGSAYVMGYDVRPLISMEEKRQLFDFADRHNSVLFLEHDPLSACCRVKKNAETGNYELVRTGDLSSFWS